MTDPRISALAEALERTSSLEIVYGGYEKTAAAILAALPPDWCGHTQPPAGTRLILASDELLDRWGTRTASGAAITAEWGEPAPEGWYEPIFTTTDDGKEVVDRAEIARLRSILAFHNKTPTGQTRECLPGCIACAALEEDR